MGSFSGCPYLSGSVGFNVRGHWMSVKQLSSQLSEIVTETKELSSRGLIDSVDNLLGDRVYIFQVNNLEATFWLHKEGENTLFSAVMSLY